MADHAITAPWPPIDRMALSTIDARSCDETSSSTTTLATISRSSFVSTYCVDTRWLSAARRSSAFVLFARSLNAVCQTSASRSSDLIRLIDNRSWRWTSVLASVDPMGWVHEPSAEGCFWLANEVPARRV